MDRSCEENQVSLITLLFDMSKQTYSFTQLIALSNYLTFYFIFCSPDGSSWTPKRSDYICSEHFVGNKWSSDPSSPSYVPTIFPAIYRKKVVEEKSRIARFTRFMERRKKQNRLLTSVKSDHITTALNIEQLSNPVLDMTMQVSDEEINDRIDNVLTYEDKECQVKIFVDSVKSEKTFTCIRYVSYDNHNDVQIQTDIEEITPVFIKPTQKKYKNKNCGTPQKIYVDRAVGSDNRLDEVTSAMNCIRFSCVKDDQQLLDLAGVKFANFQFLLKRLSKKPAENCKVSQQERLFIFLIKIKTGLTFSAISALFGVHRVTISRIFFSVLEELTAATANLVFWPEKDVIQGTMPQCFYPDYKDTRVIIDCTEFGIEVPSSVENRVFTYSHYKKGFTAKALIGITPSGFISFKSKIAGGRKSDSQITIESGLIDLLEDGDTILADKGFPDIRQTMDASGKKMLLVMPPFLQNKEQFDKEETEATYSIARVRIHVERIMQKLRTHLILNKFPASLFHCVDDILHICCVLVNLQPPIINENNIIDE